MVEPIKASPEDPTKSPNRAQRNNLQMASQEYASSPYRNKGVDDQMEDYLE
mgnify:CR=1 FL=1